MILGENLQQVAEIIDGAERIGCLGHKDADADSLGSALAFVLALRAMGKEAIPIVPDPIPTALGYLPGFDLLTKDIGVIDTLFTFDCAVVERFAEKASLISSAKKVVNVDHHVTNGNFGHINIIDPTASATGQMVFQMLTELALPIIPDIANNLYAALLSDTGGFRHENTNEAVLRTAAELVRLGADPAWVALKTYKSRSLQQVRLEALVVSRIKTDNDGALIWAEVTPEVMQEVDAKSQDSDGIIDKLQTIDTMKVAILFKAVNSKRTKISVRTRDPVDATKICGAFGGGGHHRAAGAEIQLPLAEAKQEVLVVARENIG